MKRTDVVSPRLAATLLVAFALFVCLACSGQSESTRTAETATPTDTTGSTDTATSAEPAGGAPPETRRAVADLEARSGSSVHGRAEFTQEGNQVTMKVDIEGAAPGSHAVHLHERGDCSAPDAASAGGHWNPTGENHGQWGMPPFHHGDIGNIEVGQDGKGSTTLTTDLWTIGGPPETDVLGKSVVVHATADDFKTQPSGNAGGRVGCGVIKTE